MRYLLTTILAIFILWFTWDALTQPGVQDLNGNFQEVAFYRNKNNTGPIVRIYAVSLEDTLWNEMRQYGDYMPHNKYGRTKVYFFRKDGPVPVEVFPGEENFNDEFRKNCLAIYEKDAMGNISFIRNN